MKNPLFFICSLQGNERFGSKTLNRRVFRSAFRLGLAFLLMVVGGYGSFAQNVTVNPGAGSYATLKDAFDAINAGTHTGAITVGIIGNTTESASAVLNASGTGMSNYTSIVISPSGGASRTISGSISGNLIDLNGADNVTIDGLNSGGNALTIENTFSGATPTAIRLISDATNNQITNCTIKSAETAISLGTIFFSTGSTTGNDGNTISNNIITSSGSNFATNAIYSVGAASFENSGNTVSGNLISDYFNAGSATSGINLSATGNTSWVITNNKLFQTANRTYTTGNTHTGILIGGGSGYTITGNTVGFANASGTGTTNMLGVSTGAIAGTFPSAYTLSSATLNTTRYIGISCAFTAGGTVSNIQNNTIGGFALLTSSGASTLNGIWCGINVTSGNANIGTTTGNTIGATSGMSSVYTAASTTGGTAVGIYATSTNTVSIQNNSIGAIDAVGTSATLTGGFTGIDVAGTGGVFTIGSNNIGNSTADNIRAGYTLSGSNLSNTGTLTSSTGATSVVLGIRSAATGSTLSITSNTLRGMATSGTVTAVTGITSTGANTTSVTINSNLLGTGALGWIRYAFANSGALTGITVTNSTSATTHSIQSNDIQGIVYAASSTGAHTYISTTAGTAANNVTTIASNTFTNLNVNTSGTTIFISHGYTISSTGQLIINNNAIVTAYNRGGASGSVTLTTSNSASTTGSINNYTNNNFSNITLAGTSTIVGFNNTDGGSGSTKTITGNTFNNWTVGSGSINTMNFTYWNGVSSLSNNTISNITGQSTITAITMGSTSSNATSIAVANNTITNLSSTGTGGAVTGITCSNTSTGININNNIIGGLSSTGAASVNGIVVSGAPAGGTNVFRNKIYDLSGSNASSTVNGLSISGGTLVTAYNNLIGDLRTPAANAANPLVGLNISGGTTVNAYFNTVYLNGSSSGALFGSSAVSASTTPTVTLRNNIFVNLSSVSGAGLAVAHRRSTTTITTYGAASNNNFFYAGTPGAANLIFYDGTNSDQTLAAYKTRVAPRDAASASEVVSSSPGVFFQSFVGSNAGFLHMVAGLTTQIESGAAPISGITDDYDGDVRNVSSPDMGADEFSGIAIDLSGPVITYTLLTNTLCIATGPTLSATITDASGVNSSSGTSPRIWYRKTTNMNALPATNDNTTDGWKWVEASNASSPYSLTIDYTKIFGGVAAGDSIRYFVVAQDNAGTPNLGINQGTFATPPPTVALNSGAFPVTGTNSYKLLSSIATSVTIGAAGTYPTLTGAGGLFATINGSGLSGNTTVTILDASVTETGANALNAISYGCGGPFTLTIKPGAGVNAVLTGAVGTGAIIKLNGADNVIIDGSNNGSSSRNLTIQNTTTTTSGNAVVWLASPATGNGSTNNIIKNCIIEGNASTTTFLGMYVGGNTTISLTAAGLELNNNNTITNNLFRKTQYGLALFGFAAASPDNGNIVSNNLFGTSTTGEGFNIEALHADRQINMVVSGNDVQNVRGSSSTTMYGIRLLDFKNGQAFNNKVHNLSYSGASITKIYGLAVQNASYTTAGNPSQSSVFNNVLYDITSNGTSSVWNLSGLFAGQGYGDKYYYNSIHLSGQINNSSSGLSAAFANGDDNITSFGTNMDVRNNIFNVAGSSLGGNVWAYYSRATSLAGTTQSNNVLRCAGTGATNNTARLNAINYTTLAAWQTASGVDAGSLESDPLFNSNTNLQPQVGSPVISAGVPISGITTDITGFTRNVSMPSIGGYEQGIDVIAPIITYTPLTNTLCLMNPSFTATISDASGINNTAGTKPRVWFRKTTNANVLPGTNDNTTDGWKYAEATGSMPYNFTIDYSLIFGGVAAGDSIRYFVVAQDLAATPNFAANTATFSSPPSSVALGAGVFPVTGTNSYKIGTPIPTSVTIGAAGTYPTLTGAGGLFEAINGGGLSGNTTVTIMDANITEPGTVALNAISYACAGPYDLTIKPSGTTTLTGSVATALIRLNGADRVIIDGSVGSTSNTLCPPAAASRDLTIVNTNTGTSSAVVWLQSNGSDGATNNTIKNCIITGNSNTTTLFGIGSGSSTISTSSLGTGNNNNAFVNNQISKVQYGIYTQGASAANKNSGNIINQNLMTTASPNNIAKGGILTGFENNLTVSGNRISELSFNSSTDCFGIALGLTAISQSASSGNEVTNSTITKNIIGTVINNGTYSAAGIAVAAATSGTNLIANNMISGVASNGTSGDFCGGIILGGGTGSTTQLYYNTVSMSGAIPSGTAATQTSACVAVTNSTEPILDMRDNILVNNQVGNTGATLKFASIALGYSTYTSLTSNYNDLYCAGAGPGTYQIGITGGVVSGTSRTTLTDWQTTTGKDGASVNILPVFVSGTDLHIVASDPANLPLDNGAVSIAAVTDDIDCDLRMTDIGADEFAPPACSVAMGGTASVTGPSTFCTSGTPTITATGYSNGTGSGYQWMFSTNAGDYPGSGSAVSGQTNPAILNTGVVSVTTYYWLRVTCSTGMSTDYSNMLTITITPPPTASISPSGTVNVCPPASSQLLTSSTNAMTPSYVWKKDGVTIGGETNSTYSATTTGVYTVVITDGATTCSNTSAPTSVIFNSQPTAPTITPNAVTKCFADPAVLLTASGSGGGNGVATQSSGAINLSIPDNNTTGINNTLTINGIPSGVTIDSIIVTLNITQTFDADIEVNLEAPNGQIINLIADQGSTGDNFTNTRITSNASFPPVPTSSTDAPFTATYRANAATSNISGLPAVTTSNYNNLFSLPNGGWKIRVYDDATGDTGSLLDWSIKINYTNPPVTYTWSPSGMGSGLYLDANATMDYMGTPTPTVYTKPSSTTVFTATATNAGGCTNASMVTVTVNPTPSITPGANPVVCMGSTMANLSYSAPGGSPDQYSIDFSLSAENQGFVDVVNASLPASPIVITVPGAAASGVYTATLSVKNSTTGCIGSGMPISVTIETMPNAGSVSGTTPLCIGGTTTYTTTGSGGTWSSSNPMVASVNAMTGLVTALSAGTTNISYDVPANSCGPAVSSFQALTVSPNVNPGIISGTSPLCIGANSMFSTNGDLGGVWASTNTMVATVDPMTGAVSAISAGSATITYTINSGCGSPASTMFPLTVSPNVNPGTISGTSPLCIGANSMFSTNGDIGGVWASTNTMVATVDPMTGAVSAVSAGSATITYTINSGCGSPASTMFPLTVSPNVNPGIISGTSPLCIGANSMFSTNGDLGGVWASTNTMVATVDPMTGAVSAVSAGSATITYTINSGCGSPASAMFPLTVSPNVNPGIISGMSNLCVGATDPYTTNGDAGGVWSSTNTMVATVDPMTGVVTAIAPGTANIVYTLNSGCGSPASSMKSLTVDPLANAGSVSGTAVLCVGVTDTYTSTGDPGGVWTSTNSMVATVDPMTGVVTTLSAGTTDIRYTVNVGCGAPVFSFQTLTVSPSLVMNTNDSGAGSLRDIISCVGDGATITFDGSLTGQTITLTTGELIINKNLTFSGLGAVNLAISGNGASRVFHLIPGKTLTITGLKLKDGSSMTDGGAALVEGYLILQNVIFENNIENGVPKSMTVTPMATVEFNGNVDLKN